VHDVTSSSIKISWHEPERPNGVIHAYRVYYMFLNQTLLHLPMLKNDASVGPPFHYTLINLSELEAETRPVCLIIFELRLRLSVFEG
jgi:hypothetical protein